MTEGPFEPAPPLEISDLDARFAATVAGIRRRRAKRTAMVSVPLIASVIAVAIGATLLAGGTGTRHITMINGPTAVCANVAPKPAAAHPYPFCPPNRTARAALEIVKLTRGAPAGSGYWYSVQFSGFAPRSILTAECFDTLSPRGFFTSRIRADAHGAGSIARECYSPVGPDHWVSINGVDSHDVVWNQNVRRIPGPSGTGTARSTHTSLKTSTSTTARTAQTTRRDTIPPNLTTSTLPASITTSPPPPTTIEHQQSYAETTGGPTHTWSDYETAGGTQGVIIPAYATVEVECAVHGFQVADGNTWWYRIASSPWNDQYYASADAFYNNGETSGSLIGTPFVDPNVPLCGS